MIEDLTKLHVLLPDAQAEIQDGIITEWFDERPQPTYAEINAVSDEDAADFDNDREEDRNGFQRNIKALAQATWKQENRLRALEGKSPVTFRRFLGALRKL